MIINKQQLTEMVLRQQQTEISEVVIREVSMRMTDRDILTDARRSGLQVERLGPDKFIINEKLTYIKRYEL